MALSRWKDLCIDAVDADLLGRFWAAALGRTFESKADGGARLSESVPEEVVWINPVPEPKTVKHRVHLDVDCGAVEPFLEAGAPLMRPKGDGGLGWTGLADAEGGGVRVFPRHNMPPPPPGRLHRIRGRCP